VLVVLDREPFPTLGREEEDGDEDQDDEHDRSG
jgi:hypothetical protein